MRASVEHGPDAVARTTALGRENVAILEAASVRSLIDPPVNIDLQISPLQTLFPSLLLGLINARATRRAGHPHALPHGHAPPTSRGRNGRARPRPLGSNKTRLPWTEHVPTERIARVSDPPCQSERHAPSTQDNYHILECADAAFGERNTTTHHPNPVKRGRVDSIPPSVPAKS